MAQHTMIFTHTTNFPPTTHTPDTHLTLSNIHFNTHPTSTSPTYTHPIIKLPTDTHPSTTPPSLPTAPQHTSRKEETTSSHNMCNHPPFAALKLLSHHFANSCNEIQTRCITYINSQAFGSTSMSPHHHLQTGRFSSLYLVCPPHRTRKLDKLIMTNPMSDPITLFAIIHGWHSATRLTQDERNAVTTTTEE
jgi:hypothetical protein